MLQKKKTLTVRKVAKRRVGAVRRRRIVRKGKEGAPLIRKPFSQPEWASCTECLTIADKQSNTMYGPNHFSLLQFNRASFIAASYREFRITGVKFTIKPTFDTFTATVDGANQIQVPQLYYYIDRTGVIGTVPTLANLKEMGARPHRLDDRNVVIKYRPAVVAGMYNNITAPNPVFVYKRVSPWLNTNSRNLGTPWNANNTPHQGLWFYLDAGVLPGDGAYEYKVDIEVNFQFRGAMTLVSSTP